MLNLIEGQTAEELLGCWDRSDLYDFAKELNIKNRSKMNKAQLAMAIESAMQEVAAEEAPEETAKPAADRPKKLYDCWDCCGSGIKEVYKVRGIDGGICYTCKGTGKTGWPDKAAEVAGKCKHKRYFEGVRTDPVTDSFNIFRRCKSCETIFYEVPHPNQKISSH